MNMEHALGFGFQRSSQSEVHWSIATLLDADFMFVDTASRYKGGEAGFGNALRGRHDRFLLST